MANVPAIPSIPPTVEPQLWQLLTAIKTNIDYLATNQNATTNAVDQAQLEAAVAAAVSGITKGDPGAPGAPGANGANGKSYVLDITGGRTSIVYDATGANPLPAMAAFGCEFYEDGVLITSGLTYSWFTPGANSLLSGSSSASTFTPTVAGTFDHTKSDNSVQLIVTYAGMSFRASEPVAITKIGTTGANGATGPQGAAGTPGAPGTSSYFHVAYADSADGSINFNQVSGTYIGTYVDSSPTDSSNYADYQWVLIKGAQGPQGDQGIPGTNGADGTTSYLHIKYSDDGGATFTAGGGETVGKYIGTYVDTTPTDSTSVSAYTWALIKGADGNNGKTYLLFITGGKTNAVYDSDGLNPLPAPTAFSAELYEDGALVTPATYAWSVPATNSLLSGSSSSATFTPTLASTFDINKGDNRVLLTCTYAGQTIKAVQPIAITQQVSVSVDTSTPAAIDNLTVTGGVLYNFLQWGTIPGNTDHVAIYRAATDDRASATIVGTSKTTLYADYIPSGVGTTYFYWIRAISKAGVVGDWNLVSGSVSSSGTSAAPSGIGDSQVSSISATKIVAAALSAITANLGTVTAGTIQSPDGTMTIDLSDKSITIAGADGVAADDYILIKNGQVQNFKWTGSVHQQAASLQTIESGQAANGATVTLSRWYPAIPNIIVTPNDTPIYNASYSAQSQKLQVRAENVSITGGGVVSFTAVSRLVLSGSNPSTIVNQSSGSISSNTYTSTAYTSSPNTTKIDVSLQFTSQRGTGTVPNYYYRKVQARLGWRTSGSSGAYTYSPYTTVNMGADFGTYTANLTSGTITSGTWQFIVECIASDKDGTTFSSGSVTYDYHDKTIYLAANSALTTASGYGYSTATAGFTLPAYTADPGFESYSIYQVDYTVSYGLYLSAAGSSAYVSASNGLITSSFFYGPYSVGTNNVPAATGSYSYSSGSYTTTPTGISLVARGYGSPLNQWAEAEAKFFAAGTYAVVKTRKAQANSTTPANNFTLVSYALTLSTATVIDSSGTLNWMAIG